MVESKQIPIYQSQNDIIQVAESQVKGMVLSYPD